MKTVTPREAKALREILLAHDANTLDPDCKGPANLSILLDHLRGMLMDIQDQKPMDAVKALKELIQEEDQKMDAMPETDPARAEKFCYILGLAKALSIIGPSD